MAVASAFRQTFLYLSFSDATYFAHTAQREERAQQPAPLRLRLSARRTEWDSPLRGTKVCVLHSLKTYRVVHYTDAHTPRGCWDKRKHRAPRRRLLSSRARSHVAWTRLQSCRLSRVSVSFMVTLSSVTLSVSVAPVDAPHTSLLPGRC